MMKIGFIGLGVMGKPMSKNLMKAGYDLVIVDRHPTVTTEYKSLGVEVVSNPREVAELSDVIITMLPNSPQVKEVVLGKNGLVEGMDSDKVLIDMSSIAPLVSREIYDELAKKDIEMLDAPVSGGEPKAIDGTLSVMVGGQQEVFDQFRSVLEKMAGSVVYVGEIGAGNIAKLANQTIVALNIAAVSEAFILAKKAGVELDTVFQAIRGGLAGSTVLEAKAPMILNQEFEPGFRLELHMKDLANVLETSHEVGAPTPLTSAVMEMMQILKVDNIETEDHSALIKYYEKLANTQ